MTIAHKSTIGKPTEALKSPNGIANGGANGSTNGFTNGGGYFSESHNGSQNGSSESHEYQNIRIELSCR